MNKTIKKIVALGMGATMLAGTAAMALAADLSAYPSPFVKDGAFVGKIVIGEKAASIDTVGAMDVAASLQRASSVSVGGIGSAGSATTADGYKFSENKDLVLGSALSSVTSIIDDTDLPTLLASGTVEAEDGTEYDYDVEIDTGASAGKVAATITSDLEDLGYVAPIVYFNTNTGTDLLYKIVIDFQDNWAAADFKDSETIELFGTQYTFDPDNTNADDVLTLYGSETTLLVAKGNTETVKYNGKDYTIEVLGGNSDDASAIVRINGDTKTVSEKSRSKTIGGLPVFAKNVFVSNIGGDDVSVQLFVGSNKLELDTDGTVTKNGVELDGVTLTLNSGTGNWSNVDKLTFAVTPSATDDEVDFILPGKSYVDPIFGAFKFQFVGATDLMAGKDLIDLERNGGLLDLTFTPRSGTTKTVSLVEDEAAKDFVIADNLGALKKNNIFLWNDGTAPDNMETHILKVIKIKDGNNTADPDFEVQVEDLNHGKTYTATSANKALSSDIQLYLHAGTAANDNVDFVTAPNGATNATTNYTFYTSAGAEGIINLVNLSKPVITVVEDVDDDTDTLTSVSTVTLTATYDTTDDEYDIDVSGAGSALDKDDNVDYYLTAFGTYVAEETDDSGAYAKLYVPAAEVHYDMFLMPINSEVTVSSGSTGGAVALNPISVGMAILDSEATLGSKPYIVIGGPCANTVAAALMGNPANCVAGFTEGKAMIKLFSDKNALLVAGFSGKDTQGACRVLSNYNNPAYALSGSEVEVVTANLQSLSVKKVSS